MSDVNARETPPGLWQSVATLLLFGVVCLTWGTTWIGIKYAVDSLPPLTAAGLRFVVAFPLLLGIAVLYRQPMRYPRGSTGFFAYVVIGYFLLPYFLINYGEQYVSSGLSALLFSAMPAFSLVFSVWLLGEEISPTQVFGMLLGFVGFVMILLGQNVAIGHRGWLGAFAVFIAALLHGLAYVMTKRHGRGIGVVTYNVLPIGIAGALMTIAGVFIERPDWSAVSFRSWSAVFYLGTVASVAGFIAYFHLLKRMSPFVTSYVFLIFPVVSVTIDVWLEGAVLSADFAMWCALILFGFALARRGAPEVAGDTRPRWWRRLMFGGVSR